MEVQECVGSVLLNSLLGLSPKLKTAAASRYATALAKAKLPKRVPPPCSDPGTEAGLGEAAAFKAYKAKLVESNRRRLGAVLSLGAVVRSHPYDVPSFLPPILASCALLSREAPPVGTAVQKLIADFKGSHHDAWAQHKLAFTEDQMNEISAVGSGATYFA